MAWYTTLGKLLFKGLGREAAETAAREGTKEGAKEAVVAAGKAAVKESTKAAGKAVTSSASVVGKAVKGVVHVAERNPKTVIAAGAIAYHRTTGNGISDLVTSVVGGDEAKEKGVGYAVNGFLFGKKNQDKAMMGNVIDTLAGNGTSAAIADKAGAVATGVGNAYGQVKDQICGMFQGNGMVDSGNGMMSDPSQQYPDMSQMMGVSGQGVAGNLMSAMNRATSSVTGGNITKMNMAGLLLSAYMMFGRFGWLGKAASMMLGGMTLRNINQRNQTLSNMQVQQIPQPTSIASVKPELQTMEMPVSDEDRLVVRTRGL